MGIKNRRERQKEEMRDLILQAANEIVISEGFEGISIRKIAKKIEYSPSIIYHYFKDKEDILNQIMKRGYKKIVESVDLKDIEESNPKDKLIQMTRNYIKAALSMPEEFLAAQINQSSKALEHTSSLFKGASKKKPALSSLYKCLEEVYKVEDKNLEEGYIELNAQMIATSTLGLIIKLIIEKDIKDEQRERLINHFLNDTLLKLAGIK